MSNIRPVCLCHRRGDRYFNIGASSENTNSTKADYRPAGQIGDRVQLFDSRAGSEGEKGRKSNFFSFEFYQQYFDVDTDEVASRILNSMVPRFNANFITDHIQPVPDLYGPFWVCVTLVFTTAICGNLAKYVETYGDVKNHEYGSDFRLVTGASTLIACYVILIPFALYSLFWYRRSELQYSYLEILCAYGYSLSIFVPVSMLWVIHAQWFRWLLILVSVVLSGAVLTGSVWPAVRSDPNKAVALGTVATVLLLHALLAVGFKEFYFDASQPVHSNQLSLPEHFVDLTNAASESAIEVNKLAAVGGNAMEGGNSSKRALAESALGNEDTVNVDKNANEAVDTKTNATIVVGTMGDDQKSAKGNSGSAVAAG
ncbi:Protein YIPF1 [Toxocara canis]|uniref:Protein YIPF n=1 Tax=Toxocara canis TaxID=6265 RepID=A0A0B2V9X6_TOXCA|nr:Protein YIPF1 [Toxocara canis]